jgi:hypothetical protein
LDRLVRLEEIYLSYNQIRQFENLHDLTHLHTICLIGNKRLDTIPMITLRLRTIRTIRTDQEIDPIVQRYLVKNSIKSGHSIFNDTQNVHDQQINKSISESLYRLMDTKINLSEKKIIEEIRHHESLSDKSKNLIMKYIKSNDVHSVLNVTFKEVMTYVWNSIRSNDYSDEIVKVLDQEIQDSETKCFTGRLSRLVNCLNGFDPRVCVNISSGQEIANIIVAIRGRYNSEYEQIIMIKKELTERGYDDNVIKEWIGGFD